MVIVACDWGGDADMLDHPRSSCGTYMEQKSSKTFLTLRYMEQKSASLRSRKVMYGTYNWMPFVLALLTVMRGSTCHEFLVCTYMSKCMSLHLGSCGCVRYVFL